MSTLIQAWWAACYHGWAPHCGRRRWQGKAPVPEGDETFTYTSDHLFCCFGYWHQARYTREFEKCYHDAMRRADMGCMLHVRRAGCVNVIGKSFHSFKASRQITEHTWFKPGGPIATVVGQWARPIVVTGSERYKAHVPEGEIFIYGIIRVCKFVS